MANMSGCHVCGGSSGGFIPINGFSNVYEGPIGKVVISAEMRDANDYNPLLDDEQELPYVFLCQNCANEAFIELLHIFADTLDRDDVLKLIAERRLKGEKI